MSKVMLTKDFSAAEFDTHREAWPKGKDANRQKLAERAQWVRDRAGSTGIITNAARDADDNNAVGGSETSQHLKAEAIDIVFPLCPMRVLAERVLADLQKPDAPKFGQLIFYPRKGHVHMSVPSPALGNRNGEVLYEDADVPGLFHKLTRAAQLPILSETQTAAAALVGVVIVAGAALVVLSVGTSIGGTPR